MLLGWAMAAPVQAPEPLASPPTVAAEAMLVSSAIPDARPVPHPLTPTSMPTPGPVEIPATGTGRFTVAAGKSAAVGEGDLVRYTVEVEAELSDDPQLVANIVEATLADPRSWIATGEHAFQRIDTDGDVRVLLATPSTTDELCAPLRTRGEVSCRNGKQVVLNAKRWHYGIDGYGTDLDGYRQYLVNHEMGHALGFSHVDCPGAGEPAPVMLQQSYGLDGCTQNPWPYP
jgi:Protein of unknown function (DUF3152)